MELAGRKLTILRATQSKPHAIGMFVSVMPCPAEVDTTFDGPGEESNLPLVFLRLFPSVHDAIKQLMNTATVFNSIQQ